MKLRDLTNIAEERDQYDEFDDDEDMEESKLTAGH